MLGEFKRGRTTHVDFGFGVHKSFVSGSSCSPSRHQISIGGSLVSDFEGDLDYLLPEHAVAKPFIRVRFVTVSRTNTIAGLDKLFKAMELKRWSSHLNREVVNVIKSFMGASLCPRRGQPIGRADRIAGTGSSWASLGSTSSVHQFVAARRACIFFSGQHTVVYQETTFISWILAVELNNTVHCIETDTFSRVGIRHQGRTPAEAWLGPASRPATGCSFAPLRLKCKKNK